jgi:hypothetical protein
MIVGVFPPSVFPIVGSLTAVIAVIACYYIAVKNGDEPPWPHSYISNTTRHYPEYIYFRIGTIAGAVFNILTYFVNYFWQHQLCREAMINVRKFHTKIPLLTGTIGILFLFVSTATIDTGRMDDNLHVHSAGLFFIFTVVACLLNTLVCWLINSASDTKKISSLSMDLKIVLCVLLLIQAVLQVFYADGFFAVVKSDLGHILEYTLSFTVSAYMLLFAYDFKDFKMAYHLNTAK